MVAEWESRRQRRRWRLRSSLVAFLSIHRIIRWSNDRSRMNTESMPWRIPNISCEENTWEFVCGSGGIWPTKGNYVMSRNMLRRSCSPSAKEGPEAIISLLCSFSQYFRCRFQPRGPPTSRVAWLPKPFMKLYFVIVSNLSFALEPKYQFLCITTSNLLMNSSITPSSLTQLQSMWYAQTRGPRGGKERRERDLETGKWEM